MSRVTKWKLEKAKVKVVFRLQFHATHVPQAGWDKLFISFIPADSIKPTAKTTKALVRNGTCKWGDPIYETTRLLQDTRTKQYDEKLYKIVVAMGTSRSSILGEAMIDLAEYADALKPFAVVLPLQGCDSGAILHVTVQLLTSKTGFREFEQQRELSERGSDHNSPDETRKEKFRGDPLLETNDSDSALGFDLSSNTSGSLNLEKHENGSLKSAVSGDLTTALAQKESNSDWGNAATEENVKLKGYLEDMEASINEIKTEVSSLQCHADDIGSKAQDFSQILISEIGSGDQLVREVSVLKSECSKLKEEMNRLRMVKTDGLYRNVSNTLQVRWLQGLSVLEDNIRETQNKVCYGRDSRSFVSEFESLLGVLLDFKRHIEKVDKKAEILLDTDIYPPELDPLQYLGMPELATSREPDSMRDKILELVRSLDESKAERDGLTKKMDQMECYYESLVQELEETQRQLLLELQSVRTEHSACFYSISEMEKLRRDMNEQTVRFSEEKRGLDALNEELNRRASASEAALKRARLNYSIAVNHLQKDLELLSSQVVSMFESNESLIKQALPDDSKIPSERTAAKGEILLDDLKRSLRVQEGLYRKVEEELYEMQLRSLYLEVFSNVLKESFIEASGDVRMMKAHIDELGWQLDLSTEAKEVLKQRLDVALDEVVSLNEEKAAWDAVASQNRSLAVDLENLTHENLVLLQKIDELEPLVSEFKNYEMSISQKNELIEKEALEKVRLQRKLDSLQAEFDVTKRNFDDLQKDLSSLNDKLMNTLDCYNGKLVSSPLWEEEGMDLDLESGDLTEQLDKFLCKIFEKSFVLVTEKAKRESDLTKLNEKHENEMRLLVAKNEELGQEISRLSSVADEHGRAKVLVEELAEEKKGLLLSLQDKSRETLGLLRELEVLRTELGVERSSRQEVDIELRDLTSELVCLKQIVSDMEQEKANASYMESWLLEMMEFSVAADVQIVFTRAEWASYADERHKEHLSALDGSREIEARYMDENTKLSTDLGSLKSELEAERDSRTKSDRRIEELGSEHLLYVRNARLESSFIEEVLQCLVVADVQLAFTRIQCETCIDDLAKSHLELRRKHTDMESALNKCLVNESRYMEENSQLLSSLDVVKSELESYMATKSRALTDSEEMSVDVEKYDEEEIESLMVLKAEAEITVELLKEKVTELRSKCSDLTQKLSEQILKTEEFKSLSVHLKDNVEAERARAQLTPQQESLRIIFIKEQYETKLQELQHQLTMSKKHSEEILMKLQDAIDEVESRRKAESSYLKRTKELEDELDCSLLSLECCKEEKQKLEALMHECKEERARMSVDEGVSDEHKEGLALINGNFRAEMLRSSLDHLNSELERMKNENLLQPQDDDNDSDNRFPGLEQELMQLRQAKEELKRIFPQSQETFSGGNALERVLALEIELAEALRGKKKSTVHLQSSFLKQHKADDEAIFQSFRDINEVIEEMLETKGRYASVETELKEMHERYSQLSLKFAEVEGERQKLMMTLKNVRATNKK